MTDYSKLKASILEDGRIDEAEVANLERVIYEDGQVDREEVEFLAGLRNEAKEAAPSFHALFFRAVRDHVLADGAIDTDEVRLLESLIFADGTVDDAERQLIRDLRSSAARVCPEFEELEKRCLAPQ